MILSAGNSVKHLIAPVDPLIVSARMLSPGDACHGAAGWVFPTPANELAAAPTSEPAIGEWATKNHGVPASGNFVVVDLEGRTGPPVIVEHVRVEITRRSAALTGTYPLLSGGCGGIVPDYFSANLDNEPVAITPTNGVNETGGVVPAVSLPHQVSESSPEVWYVRASTENCYCEWTAHLEWTSAGKRGESTVGPFPTSGTTHATRVTRNGASWSPAA